VIEVKLLTFMNQIGPNSTTLKPTARRPVTPNEKKRKEKKRKH
jgi:hypothetical protein